MPNWSIHSPSESYVLLPDRAAAERTDKKKSKLFRHKRCLEMIESLYEVNQFSFIHSDSRQQTIEVTMTERKAPYQERGGGQRSIYR